MMQAQGRPTRAAWRASSPPSRRNGAVLVAVVACLATFSLIALAMLRGSLASRGQLRSERYLRQAELLLDAAVERAVARLAAGGVRAADDLDETLEIATREITGGGAARLTLDASSPEDVWQLEVVCLYPVGNPRAVRRSRTVSLPGPRTTLSNEDRSPSPEETVP